MNLKWSQVRFLTVLFIIYLITPVYAGSDFSDIVKSSKFIDLGFNTSEIDYFLGQLKRRIEDKQPFKRLVVAIDTEIKYRYIAWELAHKYINLNKGRLETNPITTAKLIRKQMQSEYSEVIHSSKIASSSLNNPYLWNVVELQKAVHEKQAFKDELLLFVDIQRYYAKKADFIEKVFPLDTLVWLVNSSPEGANKRGYAQLAIKFHMEIFNRDVGNFLRSEDIKQVRALLEDISDLAEENKPFLAEARKLQETIYLIKNAREQSQEILTEEDFTNLTKLANEEKFDEAEIHLQKIVDRASSVVLRDFYDKTYDLLDKIIIARGNKEAIKKAVWNLQDFSERIDDKRKAADNSLKDIDIDALKEHAENFDYDGAEQLISKVNHNMGASVQFGSWPVE